MKTRTRINNWIQDHRQDIFSWSLVVGTAVCYFIILKKANEKNAEIAESINEFIREENALGNSVYLLADGSMLSVNHTS